MGLLPTCPECGWKSDETRCPRCNALKVVGCTGACSACKSAAPAGDACGVPEVDSEAKHRSGTKESV